MKIHLLLSLGLLALAAAAPTGTADTCMASDPTVEAVVCLWYNCPLDASDGARVATNEIRCFQDSLPDPE